MTDIVLQKHREDVIELVRAINPAQIYIVRPQTDIVASMLVVLVLHLGMMFPVLPSHFSRRSRIHLHAGWVCVLSTHVLVSLR